MFSKNSKGSTVSMPPEQPSKPAAPSLISIDLKILGDLNSDGEIHVDGVVEGDIRSKTLLIGETAKITGEIIADKVSIHGTITGRIKAQQVKLASKAHVVGDIMHGELMIEQGAFLEGHCKRIPEAKALHAKPALPAAPKLATAQPENAVLSNATKASTP